VLKVLLGISLALLMISCDSNSTDEIKPPDVLKELKSTTYGDKLSVIAHAGGGIVDADNAYSYTNSLEV
jgi:hypothetical protein